MIKNRILLIEPPFYRLYEKYALVKYPLSLGYLAAAIRKYTRWDVRTYNADFALRPAPGNDLRYLSGAGFKRYLHNLNDPNAKIWEEALAVISKYEPAVVGISAKSQNFASACRIARLVKRLDGNIIVIMGGPHPTLADRDILDCGDIDISVRGEGELTLSEILDAISDNKPLSDVNGILYRENGGILRTPPRELIKDLDSLPFPHETAPEVLIGYDGYPLDAFSSIFATRGCPYNCFYCGSRYIWGRQVRSRSVENVVSEIASLRNKGLKRVHFDDDTFGVDKDYIFRLCSAIKENFPGLEWSCEFHVKLVDESVIGAMRSAGCSLIQIGIESGSDEILRAMRKGITIKDAFRACGIIKKYGIDLLAFFMIGFPQETEGTLNETIRVMRTIDCDILTYSIFTPYPGTEAFDFCKERGLVPDNFDVSLYNHQSPENCFCMNIPMKKFRAYASKIEKIVDNRNALNRIRRLPSFLCRRMRNI